MKKRRRTTRRLTHVSRKGDARMVDVSAKAVTLRQATATAEVHMKPATVRLLRDQKISKGDVFAVARLAGIMAAKRVGEIIPLCHPLGLESITVEMEVPTARHVRIRARARVRARTGVEMEALAAASVAALTIYDMCKAVDRGMVIGPIQLEEKSGGRSGDWRRGPAKPRS